MVKVSVIDYSHMVKSNVLIHISVLFYKLPMSMLIVTTIWVNNLPSRDAVKWYQFYSANLKK